jgi:alkyl sulfatase BDS1-like metallo-beta-lactamase superfamily hydrolase
VRTTNIPCQTLISVAAFCACAFNCQLVPAQSKDAEPATRAANEAFVKSLPFSDRADFDDAKRGFIATLADGVIAGVGGKPAWDTKPCAFLQNDAVPATVNPSLWRQAQLNAVNGLFSADQCPPPKATVQGMSTN